MPAVGIPTNDPYYLPAEVYPRVSNKDPKNRIITYPKITVGENTGVFLVLGQSLADSSVNATYSPVNATKVDNINIWDGGCYRLVDPMLGPSGSAGFGSLFTRLADKLITAGIFQRVNLVPFAMGGSTVAEWAPGGIQHAKLLLAPKRVVAAGIPLSAISAVLWQQGAQDAANGVTQTYYKDTHDSMTGAFRALYGNIPWFLAKSTTISYAPIRAAIDQIVAAGPNVYAGADTDTVDRTTANRYDTVHPTAQGADTMATLWVTALDAVF